MNLKPERREYFNFHCKKANEREECCWEAKATGREEWCRKANGREEWRWEAKANGREEVFRKANGREDWCWEHRRYTEYSLNQCYVDEGRSLV